MVYSVFLSVLPLPCFREVLGASDLAAVFQPMPFERGFGVRLSVRSGKDIVVVFGVFRSGQLLFQRLHEGDASDARLCLCVGDSAFSIYELVLPGDVYLVVLRVDISPFQTEGFPAPHTGKEQEIGEQSKIRVVDGGDYFVLHRFRDSFAL